MIKTECGIECIGLEKSFGQKTVLRNIHLRLEQGSILALVGSNGAGKTTLLKILSTLIMPSSGRALICGKDIVSVPRQIKKSIGFVSSEERSFYWRLSGRQNLEFFAGLYNLDKREAGLRADALLKAVGLEASGRLPFKEYSSGMKQALCIARAMIHEPSVLLLDEPTRSLSPDAAVKIRRLMGHKAHEEGKCILIATHNLDEAQELSDRIAIIDEGTIKASGTMSEMRARARLDANEKLDAVFKYFTKEEAEIR